MNHWAFERQAQDFQDRGLKVVEIPMHPDRLAPYSLSLYEAVVEQRIVHNGDPALAAHVNAGAIKQHERGWRLVKGKSSKPIDALMALCISYGVLKGTRRSEQPIAEWLDLEEPEPELWWR